MGEDTTFSQNALFYKGYQIFRSAPNEIRNQTVEATFQRKLKDYVEQKFE